MKTIYKYELKIEGTQSIDCPYEMTPISVGCQNGKLVLWAEVDKRVAATRFCAVYIYGTGHPMPDDSDSAYEKFLGTVQMPNGLVWHVYCLSQLQENH
jgi:hypothetical protein